MPDVKQIPVSKMAEGQSGKVVEIQGGQNIIGRLNALNIRPSKKITKVSSMLMRGPVTVQIGSAQVAMGFGMARRVMVEVVEAAT